jgi:hypothetical protein
VFDFADMTNGDNEQSTERYGERSVGGEREVEAREANKRQLEIWKKTLAYELAMMEPKSVPACQDFLRRLESFERELQRESEAALTAPFAGRAQ